MDEHAVPVAHDPPVRGLFFWVVEQIYDTRILEAVPLWTHLVRP